MVDAETIYWKYRFADLFEDRYLVYFSTVVSVTDIASGKILAQNECDRTLPQTVTDQPGLEELLADNGAVLRTLLQRAADQCLSEFISKTTAS